MKTNKIISIILCIVLASFVFTGCNKPEITTEAPESTHASVPVVNPTIPDETVPASTEENLGEFKLTETLNIGALANAAGPVIDLLKSRADLGINVTEYETLNKLTAAYIGGKLDMAVVPSNTASVLYNTTEGDVKVLGITELNTLYVSLSNGKAENLSDLSGMKIYVSEQGGLSKVVLKNLLSLDDVSGVKFETKPSEIEVVKTISQSNEICGGVISGVRLGLHSSYFDSDALNLGSIWKEKHEKDLPAAVLISSPAVYESKADDVDKVIAALSYFAEKATDNGEPILPGYIFESDKEKVKDVLSSFIKVLYKYDSSVIGGKMPDDDFYCE